MQYRGARKSLPQIANELNVDAVIEGSVIRSGDRVRIAAQLIHAATDQHLWAESYERDFKDVLSLQSEIAQRIADEVSVTVTPQERETLKRARQVNAEAHEHYLMGRYHWNKRSEPSVKKAVTHFQQAIDRDPTYAQGYAGLADCYNILGYYNSLSPRDAYPKGRAAATKALQLDGTLAEPHATLGVVKRDFEWDWAGAEEDFQRAITRNPSYVEAYHWRSTLLSLLERHAEGLLEKRKRSRWIRCRSSSQPTLRECSISIVSTIARSNSITRHWSWIQASASRTYGWRRHSNRKASSTRRSPNCKQVSACPGRAGIHCLGWRMDTRSQETARRLAPY